MKGVYLQDSEMVQKTSVIVCTPWSRRMTGSLIQWKREIFINRMEETMRLSDVLLIVLTICTCIAGCTVAAGAVSIPGGEQGYFMIHSAPPDADVYFDSVFWGETPATIPVSTTGNLIHTIRITLGGYEPWTTTYQGNPRAGQTITITATLIPAATSGAVMVTSSPTGAICTLDGSQPQTTPFTYTSVPAGTHEISVYLSGYQTFYGSVCVGEGQIADVFAQLSPVITSGALAVGSVPEGAAVYVDGIYRGVTSTTVGNLAPGQHAVRLFKSGYQDWTGEVQIQKGVITSIGPALVKDPQPVYGTVSISSLPPGAEVYADGMYIGETREGSPLVFREVQPGTHTLLLTRTGHQDYTTTGVVRAGENYDLAISLTPNPQSTTGGISLASSPSGAEAFLDNAYRGLTPLTIDSLEPGTYQVHLKLSGYQDWQSAVPVMVGQTVQMSATLDSLPAENHTRSGMLPLVVIGGLAIALVLNFRRR